MIGCQLINIFDTAWLLIGTIVSCAVRPTGGSFNSFKMLTFLAGNDVPSSINAYYPSTYESAVIE